MSDHSLDLTASVLIQLSANAAGKAEEEDPGAWAPSLTLETWKKLLAPALDPTQLELAEQQLFEHWGVNQWIEKLFSLSILFSVKPFQINKYFKIYLCFISNYIEIYEILKDNIFI